MIAQVLASAVLAAAAVSPVPAQRSDAARPRCFRSTDFEGFKPVSERAFHIRLRGGEIWRVETGTCPQLLFPMARLGLQVKSTGLICGPADWDLTVGESGSRLASPCIVEALIPLSKAEAAALPRRQRP